MKIDFVSETEYIVFDLHIKNIHSQRFCVFDLEATGPDESEDQIIQMGALLLDGPSGRAGKTFESLVRPAKPIPKAIERLTGIHHTDVETAPRLSEVFQQFVEFSRDTILVTQAGYEYDWPLLTHECKRNGLTSLPNQILDTKVLFTFLFPEIDEVISTNFLINYFHIDDSDLKRHSALGDSLLIGRIFSELLKELSQREMTEIMIEQPLSVKRVRLQKLP